MPSVTVIRTGVTNPGAPVMTVIQEGGPTVSLVSTAPQIRGSAATWTLSEHARPGKHPLTVPSAPGLRTLGFEHWVRHQSPYDSVEPEVNALRAVAESGARVRFTGAGVIPGDTWWRVESMEIEEEEKGRGGVTSRAKLTWSLKQATTVPMIRVTNTGDLPAPAQRTPGSDLAAPAQRTPGN